MRIKVVSYRRDDKAFVDARYVDSKYVPMIIANAEMAAKKNEENEGADHIVYAVKYYNKADPYQLTLYKPFAKYMTDKDFEEVQNMKDVRVYALHNQRDTSDLEYRRWKMTRFGKQTRESVEFYVTARSFDEAIAKARKFYPDCCTGQVSR